MVGGDEGVETRNRDRRRGGGTEGEGQRDEGAEQEEVSLKVRTLTPLLREKRLENIVKSLVYPKRYLVHDRVGVGHRCSPKLTKNIHFKINLCQYK